MKLHSIPESLYSKHRKSSRATHVFSIQHSFSTMNILQTPFCFLLGLTLILSCTKEQGDPVTATPDLKYLPKMRVKEFNQEVSKRSNFLSLDIDGNGFGDVSYQTYHVEDMALPGYKLKFYVGGSNLVSFPLHTGKNEQETLSLKKGDIIDNHSFLHPFAWTNYPFVLMATKFEPYFNKPAFWEGKWKDASHVYQAFRLEYPTGIYYGWVELSFNMADEKLIIHSAAISVEPGKGVTAGHR